MERLLTIGEVAKALNRSPKTIKRWMKDGDISFVRLPGGQNGIKPENFQRWIDARTVKGRVF